MAELVYSSEALYDLEKIGDYIAGQLKSPAAALNTVNAIQEKINKLTDFPYMGALISAVYDDIDVGDYRFLVCANYLAFYRVRENTVYIDRIMYGRRNYIAILFGELSADEAE